MKTTLLRVLLGQTLREQRVRDRRTLRDVSLAARVSLGYLSEVERGQKEASSELLSAISVALHVPLSQIMRQVSEKMMAIEIEDIQPIPVRFDRARFQPQAVAA